MDVYSQLTKPVHFLAAIGGLCAILLQASCGQSSSTAAPATKANGPTPNPAMTATQRYYSSVLKRPLTDAEKQGLADAAGTYRASVAKTFGLTPDDLKAKEDEYRASRRTATRPPVQPAASPLLGHAALPWDIAPPYWTNAAAPVTLPDLKGHVAVLEFWRVDCPHCADEVPCLKRLYQQYSPLGLKLVSFGSGAPPALPATADADWTRAKAQVTEWQLPFPVAFDKAHEMFRRYGCQVFPTVFVLDKAGVVRYTSTGQTVDRDARLEQFVRSLMNPPAQAAPHPAP